MVPVKTVLDTDIGTDVDDALALALALNSSEIELLAVAVVSTEVKLRGRLAAKILKTWGRGDIPVAAGQADTFDGRAVSANPVNQQAVLTAADAAPPGNGIDLMIEAIQSHPGEVTLVSIGQLTNVATAFEQAPELTEQVQRLVMMAGAVEHERKIEYNVRCDPAAAAYVFDLPVEKVLIPLDVTTRCQYREQYHTKLAGAGTARSALIWQMFQAWQETTGRSEPILHDPLAVAVSFVPELVTLEPTCLTVATEPSETAEIGQIIPGEGRPNLQVATNVDVERLESLFAERLARSNERRRGED